MADYDLGTARGHIEIDASGAEYGVGKAKNATQDLSKSLDTVSANMTKAGAVMVAGAGIIAAGFALAIKSAAEFESRISGIAAVSGSSGKELDEIRKKALQLGADTKFSASEAAEAIEELVKAGIPVKDVMNGAADGVVALAAAGGIDLPQAATIAANAMNQFGIEASKLPHVADVLAGAANASAADVGQLGEALQQVGAVARTVGLSFEDTVVALSALADAGIKGSDAGTSLKTFLVNLIPSTKEAAALMEKLGIVTYEGGVSADEYGEALKDLKPAQDDVKNAQKDLNDLLADFKAQDIDATARAQADKMDDVARATEAVADAQRDYQQLQERMAAGATEDAETAKAKRLEAQQKATRDLQNAEGALADLRARQAAAGEADTELERVSRAQQLRDAIGRVTEAQKALADAGKQDISSNVSQAVSRQQQMEDALRKVSEANEKLNKARNQPDTAKLTETEKVNRQQALRDATEKNAAAQAELNKINGVLEGGVGQLSNKFFDQNGKLKSLAEVSQVLQDALKGQTEQQKLATLQTLFGTDAIRAASVISREGGDGIKQLYGEMSKATAADVAGARMKNLKGDMEQLTGSIETAAITFGQIFQPVIRATTQMLTGLVNAFSDLSPSTQKIIGIIAGVVGALLGFAGTALIIGGGILKLKKTYDELAGAIKKLQVAEKASKAMQALNTSFLTNPVFLIIAALVALGVALYVLYQKSETFRNFIDGMWQSIQTIWDAILGFLEGLVSALSGPFEAIKQIISIFADYWINTFQNMFKIVKGLFDVFAGLFTGDWGRMWDGVKAIFGAIWDQIGNLFGTIFELLTSKLGTFILDILGKFGKFLVDLVVAAGKGLWDLLGKFGEFMTTLPARMMEFIGFLLGLYVRIWIEMFNLAVEWIPKIVSMIFELLMSLPGRAWEAFTKTIEMVARFGRDALSWAADAGTKIVTGIINVVRNLPGNAWQFLQDLVKKIRDIGSDLFNAALDVGGNIIEGIFDFIKHIPDYLMDVVNAILDLLKEAGPKLADGALDLGKGLVKGFLKGIGKNSPSLFERNMKEVLHNVGKQVDDLQGHTETIQRLSAMAAGAGYSVAYSASVSALTPNQAAVASGATGGSNVPVVQEGDTYNFHEVKADPMEIAEDISWKKRLRVRN